MKKYKLSKDLPLAKAGTEVFINENINMICKYGDDECVIPIAHIIISEKDEWLEEVIEKPKSVWELQKYNHEPFYRINEEGIIKTGYLCKEYMENALNLGILFLTRAEAEKELKKRKAIQKIKKYCWENNIDTKHNGDVYSSYSFNLNNSGKVVFFGDFQNGNPLGYFSNKNAQKILENFEEELKIILN